MNVTDNGRATAGSAADGARGFPPSADPRLARLAAILPMADLTAEADGLPDAADADPPAEAASGLGEDLAARIARTLYRTRRGHVLVTGPPGVGKTTLLRRLARRVRRGDFPFLAGARVLLVDAGNVGPEDSRACLESVFEVAAGVGDLVLCLDGVAALMKRPHGGTNKPLLRALLARGGLRLVGTMTPWEYAEHVAGDAQMLETFARLELAEPSGAELAGIVAAAARGLADEFGVEVPPEAVDRAVAATSTFLLGESHPAKAVGVLREACEDAGYDLTQLGRGVGSVTAGDVVRVVSRRTGIPPETVEGRGRDLDFAAALSAAVVGQDAAVREAAAELELISAGLAEPGKPASVMMFAGTTGVGKTELAKRIAELYSASRRPIVYSMGNFTEPHSVSGIVGVPPGYVGHEEGGRLVNELRADPYSVFLLDEAEKCHPNVWKPFLNLFDEGWIVDQRGVKAYADRAIFLLTTNAGDRNVSQLARAGKPPEEVARLVRQALSRVRHERSGQPVFPPQFLSRVRRILVFEPLDGSAMAGIAGLAAARLARRWEASRGKRVAVAPEVVARIAAEAHELNEAANGQEGGRLVRKLLGDRVERAIHRRSLADRAGYEACAEILVGPADGADDGTGCEVTFR